MPTINKIQYITLSTNLMSKKVIYTHGPYTKIMQTMVLFEIQAVNKGRYVTLLSCLMSKSNF